MGDLSNIGYSTYYLGVPGNIQNCLGIYLYRQPVGEDIITLYNVQSIFKRIQEGTWPVQHIESYREDIKDYFILTNDMSGPVEFDTIIYLSNDTQSAVGFTSFSTIQSTQVSPGNYVTYLRIQLNFSVEKDKVIKIELVNTLSSLYGKEGSLQSADLLKDPLEGSNYTKIPAVKDYFKGSDNYVRYTGRTVDLLRDKTMKMITDSSIFTWESGEMKSHKFFVGYDVVLNYYNQTFKYYSIGNYKGDLVFYEWNDDFTYKMVSLTDINRFGVATEYFSGKIEPPVLPGVTYVLDYMAYCYAIFTGSDLKRYIYNFSTGTWQDGSNDFYVDPWDPSGSVVYFGRGITLAEQRKYPDLWKGLQSIVTPLSELANTEVTRKIGSWFLFTGSNGKVMSSPTGTLYLDKSENVKVINDRCLLVTEIGYSSLGNIRKYWTFYFFSEGQTIRTDTYMKSIEGGSSVEIIEETDKEIYVPTQWSSNVPLYKKRLIITCPVIKGAYQNPLIDGLRRRPLESYNLPGAEDLNPQSGILGTYCGLIFYLDPTGNKLRYL